MWSSDGHKWDRDPREHDECWSQIDGAYTKERPATPGLTAEAEIAELVEKGTFVPVWFVLVSDRRRSYEGTSGDTGACC